MKAKPSGNKGLQYRFDDSRIKVFCDCQPSKKQVQLSLPTEMTLASMPCANGDDQSHTTVCFVKPELSVATEVGLTGHVDQFDQNDPK